MKDKEFGHYKIYKNANPSSIIDYVGGNLPRKGSLPIKSHLMTYQRNRPNIFPKPTIESKGTSPKITLLNPVIERYITDEESSSFDSKKTKDNIPLKSYKNLFRQYKSVNTNFQFSNNSINNRIYNSSNKIYNYKLSKKSIRNNKYLSSSSWANDKNLGNYNSPFTDEDDSKNNLSLSKSSIDEEKSEFNLNNYPESDLENQININNNNKKPKHKDFQEKIKDIKLKFYVLISFLYFSLYLLCVKIALNLSIPETPALGVSLFLISFNNLILSLLFIKLDQVTYPKFLKFKIGNFFLKILFNYIRILLVLKSLKHLNLLSFIIIINMTPLIISYITIRENNQSFKISDSICYFIFFIICSSEFIVHNKISMLCTFTLMIINTFIYLAKINVMRNIHSYIIDFGSSLIGIAFSPLLMSINGDYLNISISQYILFLIICFTYFLNHYFESKFIYNSLGQKLKIFSNIFIVCLYILYSNFLLRENNHLNSYLFLGLSFFINMHARLRIDSNDI